jgi:hypothetical protein
MLIRPFAGDSSGTAYRPKKAQRRIENKIRGLEYINKVMTGRRSDHA